MSLNISGKIKNIKKFYKDLKKAVLERADKLLHRHSRRFVISVQNTVTEILMESPTYNSLINGPLRGHFGFPEGLEGQYADYVVNTFVDNIGYKLNTYKLTSVKRASVVIGFSGDIYKKLYNDPLAYIITEKGAELPWLEWLLEGGNTPLVIGHHIVFINSIYSRSGIALMKKGNNSVWYVPPEHQGTSDNNWITRALESNRDRIQNAIDVGKTL